MYGTSPQGGVVVVVVGACGAWVFDVVDVYPDDKLWIQQISYLWIQQQLTRLAGCWRWRER